MNYKLFFDSAVAAGKTLGTGWSYKAAATAIMVLLLHKHAVLFYAFSLLVFVDCFTNGWQSRMSILRLRVWPTQAF